MTSRHHLKRNICPFLPQMMNLIICCTHLNWIDVISIVLSKMSRRISSDLMFVELQNIQYPTLVGICLNNLRRLLDLIWIGLYFVHPVNYLHKYAESTHMQMGCKIIIVHFIKIFCGQFLEIEKRSSFMYYLPDRCWCCCFYHYAVTKMGV